MISKVGYTLLFISLSFSIWAAPVPKPGLKFIENKNQWERSVDFRARVPGGQMYMNSNGFYYLLWDEKRMEEIHDRTHEMNSEATGKQLMSERINGQAIKMHWQNTRSVAPRTYGKSKEYYNYFLGNDTTRWGSRAYAFDGIFYDNAYEGIDISVYSQGDNLKYDFLVEAGADPSQIKGLYEGANSVILDEQGNLYIKTNVGDLIEKRPYAFQYIDGVKKEVICHYILNGNQVTFEFPEGYDFCEPLVIDPLLIFSTYSGSTADNWGSTATPGEGGTLYSSGVTSHNLGGAFPATPGAFQTSYGGAYDIGILKYDSTGSELLYASYLGGAESESPHSLVIDAVTRDLYILGTTSSANFPTSVNAFHTDFNGGVGPVFHVVAYNNGSDIFVSRISSDGAVLKSSTYLGGSQNDGLNPTGGELAANYGDELRGDIITDTDGNVYLSTVTGSEDFPVVNGFELTYQEGVTDAVMVKMDADLTTVLWASFMGGDAADASHTIKLASDGSLFVGGGTSSTNFPTTTGVYQENHNGNVDGWVAHIAGDGSSIIASTLTGTINFDQIYFLDMNEVEEIYVYGQTDNAAHDFPVTAGVYNNPGSGQFVQKFSSDLSSLVFSTVFGSGRGIPDISPTAFLVNECNNLYMTGWGGSVNSNSGHWPNTTLGMPVTSDAFQSVSSGSDFYFMVLTDDAQELLYGTYLGGPFSKTHVDGGTSRFDKGGIVYHAVCSGCLSSNPAQNPTSDFPTTAGAWSNTNRSENCNNAAFKYDLSSLRARLQTNSTAVDNPGLSAVCIPDLILFQNRCTGGERFLWNFGDGSPSLETPDTAAIAHRYEAPGQYVVKLIAIDEGTCQGRDTTSTVVFVFQKQSYVQDDDVLCEGSKYELVAANGIEYHWKSKDGSFESFDQTPEVTPEDTTIYYVSIKESSGCVRKDTVQLDVVPKITPQFELLQDAPCEGRPEVMVKNITTDGDDAQLIFDFGDGSTSDLPEMNHRYDQDNFYEIKLTGIREFCVYEAKTQMPAFSMKVPNVITPVSSDGLNDTFIIEFGEDPDHSFSSSELGFEVSLSIYNRWGKQVYQSQDYQNDWKGEGIENGIYYYEVEVQNYSPCKSWLHVMK